MVPLQAPTPKRRRRYIEAGSPPEAPPRFVSAPHAPPWNRPPKSMAKPRLTCNGGPVEMRGRHCRKRKDSALSTDRFPVSSNGPTSLHARPNPVAGAVRSQRHLRKSSKNVSERVEGCLTDRPRNVRSHATAPATVTGRLSLRRKPAPRQRQSTAFELARREATMHRSPTSVPAMPTLQQVASAAFPVLVESATNRCTILYSKLAEKVDTSVYFALPRALWHIWSWCDDLGYPHINALVVSKLTGIPGPGYQPAAARCRKPSGSRFATTSTDSVDGSTLNT